MHMKRPPIPLPTPPAASSGIPTFAEGIAAIGTWTDLSATRRRDLDSALTTVADKGEMPLNTRLEVGVLRARVLDKPGSVFNLTEGRMRNLRALVGVVLRRLGLLDPPAVIDTALPPAWAALMSHLSKREASGLQRFARFCASQALPPQAVTAATLRAFRDWMETRTLDKLAGKRVGTLRACWNRIRDSVPALALLEIGRLGVPKPDQFVLPLHAFPAAFQADLAAFGQKLLATPLDVPYDPAEDDAGPGTDEDEATAARGLPKPLRPSTVATRLGHCRWAASALVAAGTPIETITSVTGLVASLEQVYRALTFLKERAGGKPSSAGMHIGEIFHIIAKHHARLPRKALARIRQWRKPLRPQYKSMTKKNKRVMGQMMVPRREATYLELAGTLMSKARLLRTSALVQACSLALRATAIELLSRIPLRLANILGLRLDEHLQRADPANGLITGIILQAGEVKNDQDIVVPVSRQTALILQEWIDHYRPFVAAPGNQYLFPGHGTGDRPMTPQGMRDAIRDTMQAYVGVAVTPHQFRHLAAKLYLRDFPGDYETVRQLLAHKDIRTTIRAYVDSEKEEATRRFDQLLTDRKRMIRKTPDRKPAGPRGGTPKGKRPTGRNR